MLPMMGYLLISKKNIFRIYNKLYINAFDVKR